jgi:hypothetical protein
MPKHPEGGWRKQHVHARSPNLYPEAALRRVFLLRSALKRVLPHLIAGPKTRGAVRFLFWWLFLHRRLRPRQRGSTFRRISSGVAPERADHFPRALLVFIRATRNVRRHFVQAFRLRLRAFVDSGFPLLLSSSDASPHPLHLSVPVKIPVSDLDCDAILHQPNFKSSRKYFNFYPVFKGIL